MLKTNTGFPLAVLTWSAFRKVIRTSEKLFQLAICAFFNHCSKLTAARACTLPYSRTRTGLITFNEYNMYSSNLSVKTLLKYRFSLSQNLSKNPSARATTSP